MFPDFAELGLSKLMYKITFIFFLSLFINCASTTQFVKFPEQSVPIEDTTKSRLYVYRPISAGNGISTSIISGNKLIGTTGAKGFLCWEEAPGQTTILSKAENTDSIKILTIPGQQYYIKQSMTMGALYARNKLSLVQKNEALEAIASCSPPVLSSESKLPDKNNTIKQSLPGDSSTSTQKISQNDNKIIEQTKSKNTNLGVLFLLLSLGLATASLLLLF